MLAQIGDQNKDFDQLICDGKTLRGSAAQVDGADGGLAPFLWTVARKPAHK